MKHTNVKVNDLSELFDWLDYDRDGQVTAGEFMQGFEWLNESLNPKSLVRMHDKITKEIKRVERGVADTFQERLDDLLKMIQQPLRKISAVTEQIQNLDTTFREMRTFLEEDCECNKLSELSTDGLHAAEMRMTRRIDEVSARIKRLAELHDKGVITISLR